jgi:peptide/nickel transport system ATP-binding protein
MSVVQVDGLSVARDDGLALVRDLSFVIQPGERLGLIGESGSGKSLTALAVMGLLPDGLTATGSVTLDGSPVIGASERALRGLRGRVASVVFQEPLTALDPLMRLGAQLAEPISRHQGLRGSRLRAAVLDGLGEVSLAQPQRIARAYPHEISGGQRQRVAIAMALACRPRLLIADEPTTALDVTVQAEVLDLIDRLVAERTMAMLFISHDLAVVSRVADRVIVLRDGAQVEAGTIAAVLTAPTDPYTRTLVDSARALDRALDRP